MAQPSESLRVAVEHLRCDRIAEAQRACEDLLAQNPDLADAWNLLGIVATKLQRWDRASEYMHRFLELAPKSPVANTNVGAVLADQGKHLEAIEFHLRAITISPDFAEAHFNLGNAYRGIRKLGEAENCYRRALELSPEYWKARNNLGIVLREQGNLTEAISCYQIALQSNPRYGESYSNLGNALMEQGKFGEATASYERALECTPNHADAHFGMSQVMLLTGNFAAGWPEYDWRFKTRDSANNRVFQEPKWDGELLDGQTILIHAEQGFGDTFQFIRYVPLIKSFGPTVVFECQRPLRQLLARYPGIDVLCSAGENLPPFDCHCPLLSLPLILKTTLDTIPSAVPYVFADPALIGHWQQRLKTLIGFRVGINWHGRGGQGSFRKRDLPLDQLVALSSLPGLQLISLQKEIDATEFAQLANFPNIHRLPADFDTTNGPFMDTAAIMMNLDLVITSDTSIAHLAGALGVPVWVPLPFVPDWRWLLDRSDSPWYPTMRLFRQKAPGDWPGVFQEIKAALDERLLPQG